MGANWVPLPLRARFAGLPGGRSAAGQSGQAPPEQSWIMELQRHAGNIATGELIRTAGPRVSASLGGPQVRREHDATAPVRSKFIGTRLGRNDEGTDVTVVRELGSLQGYAERRQAIAVARLSGCEHSAAAETYDGNWHALETTASFHSGRFAAADTNTRALYGLPPAAAVAAARARLEWLQAERAELDSGDSTAEERLRLAEDYTRANKQYAAMVLGLDDDEVQLNIRSGDRAAGKANITGRPERGAAPATTAAAAGEQDTDFDPQRKIAFEIKRPVLDRPQFAQSAMFHETEHVHDYSLAQTWARRFERETGTAFGHNRARFEAWVRKQVPARISAADAELVVDEATNHLATTEARAYAHTFLAAIQAGAYEVAGKELTSYATDLLPGGGYAHPARGSKVVAALIDELTAAYRRLTPEQQEHFRAALRAAQAANPGAWLADFPLLDSSPPVATTSDRH
jgi:hypothetical protein